MASTTQNAAIFDALFAADSPRRVRMADLSADGRDAEAEVLADIAWPALIKLESWMRDDSLSSISANRAIHRIGVLARQVRLRRQESMRGSVQALVTCGRSAAAEACADVVTAFLEAMQVAVRLTGGGVPTAEVVNELGQRPVDLFVIASIHPTEAPATRQLIDFVRALPCANRPLIVAGGGVFARAEELALEMGADAELTSLWQIGQILGDPTDHARAGRDCVASRHAA